MSDEMSGTTAESGGQLKEWQRFRPADQSRLRLLVCRIIGHKWARHPFEAEGGARAAATCLRCGEMRVRHGLPELDATEVSER